MINIKATNCVGSLNFKKESLIVVLGWEKRQEIDKEQLDQCSNFGTIHESNGVLEMRDWNKE